MIASYLTPGLKVNFFSKYHDQQLVKSAQESLKTLYDDIDEVPGAVTEAVPENVSEQRAKKR